MTSKEALIALNLAGGIASIRLNKLLQYFGKPENIFNVPQEEISSISGIGPETARRISLVKNEDLSKELACAQKLGLKIITIQDDQYPYNLENIPDSPIVLYVLGEIREEDKFAMAIVGSRRASFYGLNNAQKFGYELAQRGFTIISGMARGIDTCAHQGALKAKGRTIAVMGSGFNHIYPQENMSLAKEISRSGAVISEFPLNMPPLRQNFPCRNRIVSGLSLGVVVTEAARNSGALITADFALEQGREVFALPGKLDSPTSFGTNALIKQGAKLTCNLEDILEEFGVVAAQGKKKVVVKQDEPTAGSLGDEENSVYGLISEKAVHLDEIIEKSDLGASRIAGILTMLEIKNKVKQLPGKQFTRSVNG